MTIKLVAIDIDGTLLDQDRKIRSAVKDAITAAKAQGVTVVLCTGRPLPGVKNQLAELNLNEANDYVITYNGSLVQATQSGEIISSYELSYEDYQEIEYMSRQVGSHFHSLDDKGIYTANRDISKYSVHEAYLVDMPLYYRAVDEMTPDMRYIKVMMIDHPAVLDQAIAKLPAWFLEKYTTVKSDAFYYEILNKNASKGSALQKLAEYLGIEQAEVMAIGDNENDLSMIEYAGIGVAMGNSIDKVKAAADIVTATNQEEGVAKVMKEYVLK